MTISLVIFTDSEDKSELILFSHTDPTKSCEKEKNIYNTLTTFF